MNTSDEQASAPQATVYTILVSVTIAPEEGDTPVEKRYVERELARILQGVRFTSGWREFAAADIEVIEMAPAGQPSSKHG